MVKSAFPQPITPSGYELNYVNAGLTKGQWIVAHLMQGKLSRENLLAKNFEAEIKECIAIAELILKLTDV